MPRRSRAIPWLAAGAAGTVVALLLGALAVVDHLQARGEWRQMRDRLVTGAAGYDEGVSDALYAASEQALGRTGHAALLLGLSLGALLLGIAARRSETETEAESASVSVAASVSASVSRTAAATLLDATLFTIGAVLLLALAPTLGDSWHSVLLRAAAPLLYTALAAPLAAGATPAQRLLGLVTRTRAGRPPSPARALLAALVLPLAAPLALVGLVIRRARLAAAHLAGLRVFMRS